MTLPGWKRIVVAVAVLVLLLSHPIASSQGGVKIAQVTPALEERPVELEALPRVEKKPEKVEKPAEPAKEVKPSPPPTPVAVEAAPRKPDFAGGNLPGFLAPKADFPSGSVLRGEGVNNLLGKGDTVFISLGQKDGVKPGDLFHAFTVSKEVTHPVTKMSLGFIIRIQGELKVVSVAADSSRAIIVDSPDALTAGARVRAGVPRIKALFASGGKAETKGYLVAPLANVVNISKYDVVFIDLGDKAGVEPGQLYDVLPETSGPSPGRLLVLATQDTSATALVVKSENPLKVGQQIQGSGQ